MRPFPDDAPVRVPVPGAGLDAYGPPLGFGLDLGALGAAGAVRVSLAAFSNPPGSTLAIAAGAWDPAPADPEHAASPSEPWRGAPAGAPCVLGPAYATCSATIDLADLPATPSGKSPAPSCPSRVPSWLSSSRPSSRGPHRFTLPARTTV